MSDVNPNNINMHIISVTDRHGNEVSIAGFRLLPDEVVDTMTFAEQQAYVKSIEKLREELELKFNENVRDQKITNVIYNDDVEFKEFDEFSKKLNRVDNNDITRADLPLKYIPGYEERYPDYVDPKKIQEPITIEPAIKIITPPQPDPKEIDRLEQKKQYSEALNRAFNGDDPDITPIDLGECFTAIKIDLVINDAWGLGTAVDMFKEATNRESIIEKNHLIDDCLLVRGPFNGETETQVSLKINNFSLFGSGYSGYKMFGRAQDLLQDAIEEKYSLDRSSNRYLENPDNAEEILNLAKAKYEFSHNEHRGDFVKFMDKQHKEGVEGYNLDEMSHEEILEYAERFYEEAEFEKRLADVSASQSSDSTQVTNQINE